jgi:hypothetical protein
MAKKIETFSKIKTEPKIYELEKIYSKNGKQILQTQPFLKEFSSVYDCIPFDNIPQIDKDKYLLYLKEAEKNEIQNQKEYWTNIGHSETDNLISKSKGNQKRILLAFLERVEIYSLSNKATNTLINFFNENLYYLALGSEFPKFSTEIFLSKIESLNLQQKFFFIDCARAYIDMEYKSNKNDNYLIVNTILKAKSKQLKLQIESNKNGIKTIKNDQETTKTKQRNPIKWNGNINDLAYLFWSLSKAGVVNIDSFGIDLSTMFVDREKKEILNTMFNKYSSEFDKSKYPANAADIDTLVNILKYNIKK